MARYLNAAELHNAERFLQARVIGKEGLVQDFLFIDSNLWVNLARRPFLLR